MATLNGLIVREDTKYEDAYFSDVGNAELFVEHHADSVRYVHDLKQWLVWDGTRWLPDQLAVVMEHAQCTALTLRPWVGKACWGWQKPEQSIAFRWARDSLSVSRLQAMLKLAQSNPLLAITSKDLDTHPYLLPCNNGTLDLLTFQLREPDPKDYMTKSTRLNYYPDAKLSKISLDFIDQITCQDKDLAEYLQKILGYTLTGDASRRLVFFLHGQSGRNGKSTFLEQVRCVLGDFAQVVPMQTLEKQQFSRGGSAASPDIAKLIGARFVTASESESDMKLSAAKIKELVGNDTITARALYKEGVDFKPQYKIFLATNFRPNIPARDSAVWDRLRLIPFDYVVDIDNIDPMLGDFLAENAVGWLTWMVGGLRLLDLRGLLTPTRVEEASQNYRQDMDTFSDFIDWLRDYDDEIEETNKALLANQEQPKVGIDYGLGAMHKLYLDQAKLNGWESLDVRSFSERMIDRGFKKTTNNPRRWIWPTDRVAKPRYTLGHWMRIAAEQGFDTDTPGDTECK
jgi:putative DNA primase/helicase